MEQMMEFYYLIHYVVYRFYRRHKEEQDLSLFTACGMHLVLSAAFVVFLDGIICELLGLPDIINKPVMWGYMIAFACFEYFVFYRQGRYLEIFEDYARQSDTHEMQEKFRKAKIFNYSIFAVDLIMLFFVDYCNHHGWYVLN